MKVYSPEVKTISDTVNCLVDYDWIVKTGVHGITKPASQPQIGRQYVHAYEQDNMGQTPSYLLKRRVVSG